MGARHIFNVDVQYCREQIWALCDASIDRVLRGEWVCIFKPEGMERQERVD